MIEITGSHIKELNDSDLRTLLGLLCEAELRVKGIPTAGVKWGGDQRAADGGIDVKVEISSTLDQDGYIPKPITGFQVKEPDMFPSEIDKEMRPNGKLRESIKQLAEVKGAYIIVSSNSSTANSALINRKKAMIDALSDLECPENLKLDFYDSGRIASWVRSHPSLIIWVRQKIGKPIQGWQPYANWANAPGGIEEEYLLDEEIRLYDGTNPREDGMKGVDGINMLRSIISQPGSSIRLAGLSGVGKTRMVQALFDIRIGENPLNKFQVFYTDTGHNPIPDPRSFAEQLIALDIQAVLIVDNCPLELHRLLSSVCTASGSLVSLITVEYDVRDDQPEETEVFRLEAASEDLIEKMVRARYDHVSQIDARTIAKFSGGNARVAIALADTVKKGDELSVLKDEDLFQRLFKQRHDHDDRLLRSAEVCSLVYSFDITTDDSSENELALLGSLIEMKANELYSGVVELQRRNLVQHRNRWRAVLPHAVANKLAKRALENIPLHEILSLFEKKSTERLLISFSRRLNYLHDSDQAIEITRRWLSQDGLLKDVSKLNNLGVEIFRNIAPIDPDTTLRAIEKAASADNGKEFTSRENKHFLAFIDILCALAFDSKFFERSMFLLVRFALTENKGETHNSIRLRLKTFFQLYLSGTNATLEKRIKVVKELLYSEEIKEQELGCELLSSALLTSGFIGNARYDFGARSRDFGFIPQKNSDIKEWYTSFTNLAIDLAVSQSDVSESVKKILGLKFRGLWAEARIYDVLEDGVNKILKKGPWKEGWMGIRSTLRYESKDMSSELVQRLKKLDKLLKPTELIDLIKIYACTKGVRSYDIIDLNDDEQEESTSDRFHQVSLYTRYLGKELASNDDELKNLIPELLSSKGFRLFQLGQGIADSCNDPLTVWQEFKTALIEIKANDRNYNLIQGFLNSLEKRDKHLSIRLFDQSLSDEVFAPVFPLLQCSVDLDKNAVKRLIKSIELESAPIQLYNSLAYSGWLEDVSNEDLISVIKKISDQPEGVHVALEILYAKFLSKKNIPDTLINLGQDILLEFDFDRSKHLHSGNKDYEVGVIIEKCFAGIKSTEKAIQFCKKLVQAIKESEVHAANSREILYSLIKVKPEIILDCFISNKTQEDKRVLRYVSWESDNLKNPLSLLDDELVLNWCNKEPDTRFQLMAHAISPIRKKDESEYKWTPIAAKFIDQAPDPILVLEAFKSSFSPSSWSGSRALIMEKRIPLITELKSHEDSKISDWAVKAEKVFKEEVEREREWELTRQKNRNEDVGFE